MEALVVVDESAGLTSSRMDSVAVERRGSAHAIPYPNYRRPQHRPTTTGALNRASVGRSFQHSPDGANRLLGGPPLIENATHLDEHGRR